MLSNICLKGQKEIMNIDTNNDNIHSGHRKRMRNRFLETGFNGFEPHQVIEMLLFYTCPRKDTNELAHRLINRFGSIASILDADVSELVAVSGITENTAVLFKIITKILPLYYNTRTENIVIDSTEKLKEMFIPCFVGLDHEEFRVACFDNNLKLIANKMLFSGSVSASAVNTRMIVEFVIKSKSSMVAFAHNHPKGSAAPSTNDIRTTRMVNDIFRGLGITLMDHIIVGEVNVVSMRENTCLTIFD